MLVELIMQKYKIPYIYVDTRIRTYENKILQS